MQSFDPNVERAKAKQILSVLKKSVGRESLQSGICLHTGCTEGTITKEMSAEIGSVYGIDIDVEGIRFAVDNYASGNCKFLVGDATLLPFADESFDFVVCNHIYNYVSDSGKLISEIYRILRENGHCYFAATQFGKDTGGYITNNLSYRQLIELMREFSIEDYTIAILENPGEFHLRINNFFTKMPRFVYLIFRVLIVISPSYIWIIKKYDEKKGKYKLLGSSYHSDI